MKSIILLFALASTGWAQQGIQRVHEVAVSTQTIVQSTALSWTTTNMGTTISSGAATAGYFAIEVYNVAASSNTIVCGFDLSLSTAQGSTWYGREIAAGEGVYYGTPSYRPLYCKSLQAAGGTNPVTVTLFK